MNLIVNVLAAALLLVAGAAKVAVPHPLRRALDELSPGAVSVAAVRVFAVVEVAVAVVLLLPSARPVAAAGSGALGVVFVAAGAAGHLRRSSVPCGCLGGGTHALGLRNVLAGVVFLGVAGVNLGAGPRDPELWQAAPLAAAAATILLCLFTHRVLLWRLLGPRPAR